MYVLRPTAALGLVAQAFNESRPQPRQSSLRASRQGRSSLSSQSSQLSLNEHARGGPAEASKRPPQTSALLTRVGEFEEEAAHIDFTQPPGMHKYYGNGQERPLLRGWVHFVALLLLEGVLASGALPSHTASLLRASSIGLYGSCVFHMLPWASMQAYQVALAVDFQAISLSMTGQVMTWMGWAYWGIPSAISIAASLTTLAIGVMGLLQKEKPLWEYGRVLRRNLVLLQFTLTIAVEALVIPNKWLVAGVAALKVGAFVLFLRHGRHDAPHGPTPVTKKGIWEDHDNMHALVVLTIVLQMLGSMSLGSV